MRPVYFEKELKHEVLTETVRESILRGEFKPGDMLPSQNDLCRSFGVSHHTVREAITSLVHEGLLYRIQGKGTFVADQPRTPKTIAAVMPHLHQFGDLEYGVGFNLMPFLVQAIEREAKKHGAKLVLYLSDDSIENERENLLNLIEHKIDAAVVFYTGGDDNLDCIDKVKASGIPLVFVDRYLAGMDVDYVVSSNFDAAYAVTRQLTGWGMERIFYLTEGGALTSRLDRARGYTQAMRDCGLEPLVRIAAPSPEMFGRVDPPEVVAVDALMTQLLDEAQSPFAVFTESAALLGGAWRSIRELGIPESDLALACFDHPVVSIPDEVALIHVLQPLAELGSRSVQIAMGRLDGDSQPHRIELPCEIRVHPGAGTRASASLG